MAIKGKRKPKSRGSPARRRPAAPVRPVPVATHRVRWYRTMGGQLALIVALLAVVGAVMWKMADARADREQIEARQSELEPLTREVSDLVNEIQTPVREMMGAPFNTADREAIEGLRERAVEWIDALERAGARAQALVAPDDLAPATQVLQQAFLLYGSAAKTYRLVPGEEGTGRQQDLIRRASDQRDQAGRLLVTALGMIDAEREAADMRPAGVQAPSSMTPILPTPAPEEAIDAGDRSGKKGTGRDDGKGNKKKDRDD